MLQIVMVYLAIKSVLSNKCNVSNEEYFNIAILSENLFAVGCIIENYIGIEIQDYVVAILDAMNQSLIYLN